MADPVEKHGLIANAATDGASDADMLLCPVIDHDLRCRTCGYNLRGLAGGGRCPECETPIERSLRGDLLCASNPHWVRTIARGLVFINASIVLGLVAIIALATFAQNLGVPWLPTATILLIGAVMAVGVWLATEREPAQAEIESPISTRRALRVLVISSIALQASSDMLIAATRMGALTVRLAAIVCIVAGLFCAFRYAESLARRLPDPLLEAQTRGVMWGLVISYGLFLLIAALALANSRIPPALAMVFGLSCTVFIACIMFTLWTFALVARYSARLQEAAVEAELSWTIDAEKLDAEMPRASE